MRIQSGFDATCVRAIFTEPPSFSQYEAVRYVLYIKQSRIHETATISRKAVAALPEEEVVDNRLPPDFRNVSVKPR